METKKTFPRIEVTEFAAVSSDVRVELIFSPDHDGIRRFVDPKNKGTAIADLRAMPEAGTCCPVYDYTKKEALTDG